MKKYLLSIIPWIFFFWLFYLTNTWEINLFLRALWRVSFLYIAFTLFVTPIIKLTGNQKLLPYRRTLWVISFFLAIFHTMYYFYIEYIYQKTFFVWEHFKALDIISWLIWLLLIIILWITSNNYSVKLLKSSWQKLQSLTYPLFIIVALHIAFASRFDNIYIIVITALVITRTLAYFKNSWNNMKTWKPRYLCVPCGYIYDEELWDPDSGIKPWTKWEDIPDSWRCPICGVTKSEFVLIWEELPEEKKYETTVVSKEYLTSDVVELKIKSITQFNIIPGQFATFIWKDNSWEFKRAYSVVSYLDWILTFLIKIWKEWRWAKLLQNIKVWEKIDIIWINWEFKLIQNKNKKVFLATWTWLAPIYSMISELDKSDIASFLFFWLRNIEDIFYEENLKKIKNLEYKIYCSALKEDWESCDLIKWRINLDEIEYPPNTDFYICGNPEMTKSSIAKLKEKGYTNIYFEQF